MRTGAWSRRQENARMTSPMAASAAAWSLELVGVPSVNGTASETAFAPWLRDRLRAWAPFAGQPERVWTIPVADDPLGRASVAALLRGEGLDTVVLTGHYDTVRVDDYGDLAPLATQPAALKEGLLARLRRDAATPAEARALADLESGAFLPGRGLLDMKSGLAAALAAMEAWAGTPECRGNLLFLAVPDEEANSAGARSLAQALPGIAKEHGLHLRAAINLDSLVDAGDGAAGRRIVLGTVGKLLPSAFVVGRAVHASDSLQGLNAGVLAGAIAAAVEWSPALTERTQGELAAPPTLLGLKDNRTAYDVTTPDQVWAYWNVMTHRRSPVEVLSAFRALCRDAVAGIRDRLAERAGGAALPDVPVLSFAELKREALAHDPAAAGRLAVLAGEVAARGLDLPEQCRLLTAYWWAASRRTGPAVVIGLASMPYLPTELRGRDGRHLEAACRRAAAAVGERHGTGIGIAHYFPGISDMSFLGQADEAAVPEVAAETPAWGCGIPWPQANAIGGVPIVNAGPWGRDYHTPLERLHAAYAFEVLPELLLEIVRGVLTEP
jgi:arginine utilization protein RocB